ncbi:MAG: hypothetical protein M3305_03795 [Actinomycetota bacterium]|nr:hypothetical protein [Actinomycetota bacterium]
MLTGIRKLLATFGAVGTTAPEQVAERLEGLGALDGWSPEACRALALTAHLIYGVGTGTVLGLLRRRRGGAAEEVAVGSALGILAWGAVWASWLPLAGVHLPPWEQQTPKVLLPVLDHAVFGATWGPLYRAIRSDQV